MDTKARCGFRDLPLEVRIEIYRYFFAHNEIIYVNKDWSEPTELITGLSKLVIEDEEEMLRIYYRENTFGYLLTNLKTVSGTYDYQGLLHRLDKLGPVRRKWIKHIEIVCFFSTPERVAVGQDGIDEWLRGEDRGMERDVFHFTERYWSCQPQ